MDEIADRVADEDPITRVLDWHDAIPIASELKVGDVIQGMENLEEIDVVTTQIGRTLDGIAHRPDFNPRWHFYLDNQGDRVYDSWRSGSKPPSKAMRPNKFYGKLTDFKIIVFTDIDKPKDETASLKTVDLGLFADMNSTGRGVVGKVAKKCILGSGQTVGGARLLSAKYKNIKGHDADEVAEELFAESSATAIRVARYALRHVFSAGLPG